jgi:hypothetical protein
MNILIAYLLGMMSAMLPKDVKSQDIKSKTNNQSGEPNPSGNFKRIGTEINLSEAEAHRYYSEQDKSYRLQKRIFWATLLTLFVLGLYTLFTYRIMRATQTSGETATKQLEMIDRPWLILQGVTANNPGFTFSKDGRAHLSIRPVIKNIGHSVATNITFDAKIIIPSQTDFASIAAQAQKELCKPSEDKPVGSHETTSVTLAESVLFPEEIEQSWSYGLDLEETEIAKKQTPVQIGGVPTGILAPAIVGCIDYRYPSSTHHHQTGFVYDVRRLNHIPQQAPLLAIIVGSDVAGPDVHLERNSFFGGFYAY